MKKIIYLVLFAFLLLCPMNNGFSWQGDSGWNKAEKKYIQFAIEDAENIPTHAGRSTQSIALYYNDTGKTFHITKIRAMSDEDDYSFILFKSNSSTDIGTANDTQIDVVTCSDNGTGGFYKEIKSGFDSKTIEKDKYLIFEHNSGTSGSVQIIISGTYN